ncbi:DUF2975 domain-containing protein [Shouchella lehensis]|uniref:DUF2975 domain-containing protein n=1 Tax=Shouchella lehensis TaxID=300825 RepID=A0A4Y7WI62_9BACI|nr:DUF2975 domain-containing protein [Shouchella lehensis]MBG9785599.1 hypothetical protein [Shouchella lehensis]TES48049.1 DUF2975 domain-containing protein [Shouchella lehensis]
MNLFTKIVLRFLSIASLIAQGFLAFAGLILIFASVALLVVSDGVRNQLTQHIYISSNTAPSISFIVFSCLVALAIITCLFITTFALYKIISNIYGQQFFVVQNLKYLRFILISITSFIVFQSISQLFFAQAHLYNVSDIFLNTWPNLLESVLLLSIIYTIYVVFKYGISLQEDSNNVI